MLTIDTLPDDVRALLTPDEQAAWLDTYNLVAVQTGDGEKATLAAWGMVRKQRAVAGRSMMLSENSDGQVIVRGWGMKFTDVYDQDFYNTHFSTLTELLADYYRDAPLWYEHGVDLDYRWKPIGRRHAVEIYGFGVWAEHILFTDHPLYERTRAEVERGELAYSSDSIAHYVEQGFNQASGEVRMWPLAGWSLTKSPAEPGLGPVTLDGMEATIREVVNAPARRVTLEGGTVLTLTACKSVYSPQVDPTVPAVHSPDGSEAREAQGDTRASSDSVVLSTRKGNLMDPQMLAALAEFLGVEATPETVLAALNELIAALGGTGGGGEAAQAQVQVDGSSLRSALDLADDATDNAVILALEDLRAQLAEPEPAPARSTYNYHALRTAMSLVQQDNDPMPHYVPRDLPGHDGTPAARSRSLHAPAVNLGAPQPGVEDAVMFLLGQTPPSFRRSGATRSAVGARLFQMDRAARADQNSGSGAQGAFVLNAEIAADILAPLQNKLVLFQAGAFRWPMNGVDSVTIRKQVGLPGAFWAAEDTETDTDGVEWAIAQLTLKELRAPTTWPNRWLRNLVSGAEGMIRDGIEKSMRLQIERSALFGTGGRPAGAGHTGVEPLGVAYTDGIATDDLAGAAPDIDDLAAGIAALEDADVEETDTWGWISRPSVFRTFEFMKDANNLPVMRDSWMGGVKAQSLLSYDYFKTNMVPNSATGSTLFFGDWSELVIGIGQDVELIVSEHQYASRNSTLVMGIAYVDSAVMYPEAFHVHANVGPTS